MKPEEINIAIAEICGWKFYPRKLAKRHELTNHGSRL